MGVRLLHAWIVAATLVGTAVGQITIEGTMERVEEPSQPSGRPATGRFQFQYGPFDEPIAVEVVDGCFEFEVPEIYADSAWLWGFRELVLDGRESYVVRGGLEELRQRGPETLFDPVALTARWVPDCSIHVLAPEGFPLTEVESCREDPHERWRIASGASPETSFVFDVAASDWMNDPAFEPLDLPLTIAEPAEVHVRMSGGDPRFGLQWYGDPPPQPSTIVGRRVDADDDHVFRFRAPVGVIVVVADEFHRVRVEPGLNEVELTVRPWYTLRLRLIDATTEDEFVVPYRGGSVTLLDTDGNALPARTGQRGDSFHVSVREPGRYWVCPWVPTGYVEPEPTEVRFGPDPEPEVKTVELRIHRE